MKGKGWEINSFFLFHQKNWIEQGVLVGYFCLPQMQQKLCFWENLVSHWLWVRLILGPIIMLAADFNHTKYSFINPPLGTLPKKNNGKMWEFWKNRGGGGLPESHFHFLLFLTWEQGPKMQNKAHFLSKKKHVIPKHFPAFFLETSLRQKYY